MNIFNIFQPEICYATDPWTDMASTTVDNVNAIIPLFSTPVMFLLAVLTICLVLGVIISRINH